MGPSQPWPTLWFGEMALLPPPSCPFDVLDLSPFRQPSLLPADREDNRYTPENLRYIERNYRFRRFSRQHRRNRFPMNRQRTGNGESPDRG